MNKTNIYIYILIWIEDRRFCVSVSRIIKNITEETRKHNVIINILYMRGALIIISDNIMSNNSMSNEFILYFFFFIYNILYIYLYMYYDDRGSSRSSRSSVSAYYSYFFFHTFYSFFGVIRFARNSFTQVRIFLVATRALFVPVQYSRNIKK